MKNIEDYLRNNKGDTGEFRLKVVESSEDHVIIYINPVGRDGGSFDGYVLHDAVQPKGKMDAMFEGIRVKVLDNFNLEQKRKG